MRILAIILVAWLVYSAVLFFVWALCRAGALADARMEQMLQEEAGDRDEEA